MRAKPVFDITKIIDDYLSQSDWRVAENSNMSYSLQGLNNHISSSAISYYWLNNIYENDIAEAHIDGYIHIHDLGVYSSYCVGWDLEALLRKGFGGVSGKITSAPAKHFRTALNHVVNFFFTLQGEAAGAQAFSNFDTFLAPFVANDGLDYDEVKQAMQEFIFNLNIPTRTGFQTPFTNLTFDLFVPKSLAEKPAIIGGKETNRKYGEFQKEMNMINKAFAEVMSAGDANGRIFTFPIPTYNITKDFDWDNPELDDIWRMTAKYGTPYFANFVNSDMDVDDARSMCCRLRLDTREIKSRNKASMKLAGLSLVDPTDQQQSNREDQTGKTARGGIFAANPLTGSIGVVTINMPRLAYEANGDVDEFFRLLDKYMDISKRSLEIKRSIIEKNTESGLYPYTKVYLGDVQKLTGKYWSNHFSTIGLIGMNEAVENLLKIRYASDDGIMFAKSVLDKMLARIESYRLETGNLYNLEASPAEGASYRLAKIDRKRYPDIITCGTDDAPYYTNSVHFPVTETMDIFDVMEKQDGLQSKFTGGTVLHLFLGENIKNIKTVRSLVKKICANYKMPYFSITPTFSICPVHGYIPGEHQYCPLEHTQEQIEKYGTKIRVRPNKKTKR